jgi:electron transfer flavoprotein alpha subunit
VKIAVLVKQVPHPAQISFDEKTRTLKREGVPLQLNPFDRAAVVEAARLRDQHAGGEVVAMTMGPPAAEEALREALALGADRGIHLTDRAFAVADTIGTSRTLALALEKEEADLVVCGRKAVDAETWQVPPEVSTYLGWPQLTNVVDLELVGGELRGTRLGDEGDDRYAVELPAVVSVALISDGAERISRAGGRIAAWSAADLASDVQENDKRFGQTGSPTRVLAVRDVSPERAAEHADGVDRAAERVVALLEERKPEPSSWEKPPHAAEQPGKTYDCWTAVELRPFGEPTRASIELLARGRVLAGKLGGRNVALVVGAGVDGVVSAVARHGAELVVVLESPELREYHPEPWAEAVRQVLERHRPHVLLIPATARGRDWGPRVAGELELGMTADCVGVDIAKAGRLLQQKPAYGGNIVSIIMGSTTPQLATVRPRMYEPLEPRDSAEPEVSRFSVGRLPQPRTRLLEHRPLDGRDGHALDAATVVALAGPELGAEGVRQLESLAAPVRAPLGGTREVCDAGWLPRQRQIGLNGRSVAPRLLITLGVPGDFEHLSGIVKAGVVVAINEREDAPMLSAADVALVGDWRELLPALHDRVAAHL